MHESVAFFHLFGEVISTDTEGKKGLQEGQIYQPCHHSSTAPFSAKSIHKKVVVRRYRGRKEGKREEMITIYEPWYQP